LNKAWESIALSTELRGPGLCIENTSNSLL
jgi:hypothetical protein